MRPALPALAEYREQIIEQLACARPRSERAVLLAARLRECTSELLREELRRAARRKRPRLVASRPDLLDAAE